MTRDKRMRTISRDQNIEVKRLEVLDAVDVDGDDADRLWKSWTRGSLVVGSEANTRGP